MSTPESSHHSSAFTRLQLFFAQARFFTFSALLHVIIVLLAGSVVIFKHYSEPPPDFKSSEGGLVNAESTDSPPVDEQQASIDLKPAAPTAASAPASTINVIAATSSSNRPSVTVAAAVSSQLAGLAGDKGRELGDKVGEIMKNKAAGVPGGTMTKPFGMKEKTVPSLVGTFYDLKQDRHKKPTNVSPDEYHKIFRKFVAKGWNQSILDEYFKSPAPLYTTQIMIPNMSADEGPKAFGLEKEVQPSRWLVHYKGKVSPPEDGTYHFVGAGDDVMVVRFNGKTVLDRCWYQGDEEWKAETNYQYGFSGIPNGFARGDKMVLKKGQFYDMDVLIGEQPGGLVFFCLMIEKEGDEYQKDGKGNPILPVFRLADAPMPKLEEKQTLPPYQANGPVWMALAGDKNGFDSFFKK